MNSLKIFDHTNLEVIFTLREIEQQLNVIFI